MKGINPCLWFDGQAEEAARFYTSIFKNSKIKHIASYGEAAAAAAGMPKDSVMAVTFELDGQDFMALNGGPAFKFNEAISLTVYCDSQKEIDEYWAKLTSGGGQPVECGWLKDKYGLSWQIVPKGLDEWISDKDRAKADRVHAAVLKMKKLDMDTLKEVYEHGEKAEVRY